jgi:rare lipoprotein A (peptidoglycan hydrolase)
MHLRIRLGHKNLKTQNAFNIVPLGIFLIVSSMPGNALLFESTLAVSPTPKLFAEAHIEREELEEHSKALRPPVALATPTPITKRGDWPTPQPVVAYTPTAPVAPQPVAPTVPQEGSPVLVLTGEASYYSRAGCLGCSPTLTMANGQPLNDNALTMAIGANHRNLLGRRAIVTNLATGRSVTVTITDTGGFYQARYGNRVADLTVASKNAIGMGGLGQVRVEVY